MSIESELAELKIDMKYIKSFIEEDREKFQKHIEESIPYRREVEKIKPLADALSSHSNQNILSFVRVDNKFSKRDKVYIGAWLSLIGTVVFDVKISAVLPPDLIQAAIKWLLP